ncbi:MAG: deoxyribodipyrimidine photo-lyase [Solirubrobacterales bacterium]|nr:deoxyribodipyrimidine photo-lyase [Solirubrobacterales bacterium]
MRARQDQDRGEGGAIMWYRRDLRVHDLPALAKAVAGPVLPCFILDDRLLSRGRFVSPARVGFMLGCLRQLRSSLRELGSDLVVRRGRPEEVLVELAAANGAGTVHWTTDVSPWAIRRDRAVAEALDAAGISPRAHPGSYVVDEPGAIRSGQDRPYTVFSPFAKAWDRVERREPAPAPTRLVPLPGPDPGSLPTVEELGLGAAPATVSFEPGERAARRTARTFIEDGLADYAARRDLPAGGTSRLSPYIRWGCLSPLELEQMLGPAEGEGTTAFRAELAWREFYAAVLLNYPEVVGREFQPRYRGTLQWQRDDRLLEAWKAGRTGFPLVDAGMRQLLAEGWMHNRVRMVVASFLTKDLHLDWREGERWFMEHLIDGDVASNNGGWQWVSSVGTDPAPYFQRMFNPMTQQERFDPDGEYVRRWVHELAGVEREHLVRPWLMSAAEQQEAGCRIGSDYPAPVVDHAEERRFAVERYRAAAG